MSAEFLSPTDVSYAKLVELQDRLLGATKAGTIAWERLGDDYQWATPHGVVDVALDVITIYDDSGVRLRRFDPGKDDLYRAVREHHAAVAVGLIDRILADLAALAAEAGNGHT